MRGATDAVIVVLQIVYAIRICCYSRELIIAQLSVKAGNGPWAEVAYVALRFPIPPVSTASDSLTYKSVSSCYDNATRWLSFKLGWRWGCRAAISY